MKSKEMSLALFLDKMPAEKLRKLLKTPRWWNLAQPDQWTDMPRLVGLSGGDRRKLSSGDLGENGKDAINAALDRKKGKRKSKDLTVNELLALMPKKQADKILKSRNPKMLDDGPILKTGRPGRAHIPEGSYDEEEIEATRKLAKERRAAAKRRQKSEGKKSKPPAPFNVEARHFQKSK